MRLHKMYIIVATVLTLLLVAAGVATANTVAPQEVSASPDATGTVRIVKTVPTIAGQPGETFSFSYTDPTPANGTFTLTAPGTAAQRTQTFNNAPLGIWTVTETAPLPAGWALTSITCTGGGTGGAPVLPFTVSLANRSVTLQLTQNETITCTFNNEKKVDIFVGKYEDANGNGAKDAGELRLGGWVFNLYDSVTAAFVSTATSTTVGDVKLGNQVPAGQYTVCEVLPTSGWYASWVTGATPNEPLPKFGPGSFCATATFTAASSTVEFGNVKAPEIRIVKNAVPTTPAATFTFTQTVPLPDVTSSTTVAVGPNEWVGVKCPAGTTAIGGSIGIGNTAQQTALWVPGAFVIDPPNTYVYPTTPPGTNVPVFASGETGFLAQNNGDSETSFTVSVTCQYPNVPTTFPLTGANDASAQQAFTGLKVGAMYSFEERDPSPAWAFTGLACVGGGTTAVNGRQVNVTPTASGQVITCTYTNTSLGKIIVNKTTDPSPDPGDTTFTFTTNTPAGAVPYPGFTLKNGQQNVSPGLTSGVQYWVQESNPGTSWLVTWGCVSANGTSTITYTAAQRRANVTLAAGDTVTCDYLNTKKGTIQIVKNTIGANGTFNFSGDLGAFALTTTGNTASTLPATYNPGTYVVTEASQSGWYLSGLTCVDPSGNSTVNPATGAATIALDPGETVICTYENTRLGIIRVAKVTDPVGATQTFTFTVTGGPDGVNIPLAGIPSGGNKQTQRVLKPGTYLVTEQALPDWDITGVTCSNNSVWPNVTVAAGQTTTCTVENTQRGKIIVDKVTVPAALPDVFSFSTTGPGYAPFTLTDQAPPNDSGYLVPGLYSVTEADPGADWLVTVGCSAGVTTTQMLRKAEIALAPGVTASCTYTNTRLAEIEAYKYRDLGANGVFNPGVDYLLDDGWQMTLYRRVGQQAWTFVETKTTDASGKAVFKALDPGNYAVCETQKPGWQNSDPGGPGLVPGLQGICKSLPNVQYGNVPQAWFGNYQARLTIVKVTNPAVDPQPFNFSGTWSFTLDTDPATANIPDRMMWVVQPSTMYTVKEQNAFVAPWNLQNINCQFTPVGSGNWTVTGGDTLLVTVPTGAEAVCTFTNVKTIPPPACALYDFNNDGVIDIIDLGMVAARWMNPALYDVRFDVSPAGAPDGVIDIADIAAVAVRVVSTCP